MNHFFAYQTRWNDHITVKLGDIHDELEAMRSPSVVKVARGIEALNLDEATCIARRRFEAGEVSETFAVAQLRKEAA